MNMVSIMSNGNAYMWFCDAESAAGASQGLGYTFEAHKWYFTTDNETYTLYTGPFPIDVSSDTILSESYFNRVLATFPS